MKRTEAVIFVSLWENYSEAIVFIIIVLVGAFWFRNPLIIIPALFIFMLYSDYKSRKIYK